MGQEDLETSRSPLPPTPTPSLSPLQPAKFTVSPVLPSKILPRKQIHPFLRCHRAIFTPQSTPKAFGLCTSSSQYSHDGCASDSTVSLSSIDNSTISGD